MKPDYVTVSFSGGKDSTAMVLHMIELGEHIDEVINLDTGQEFPDMYAHIEKVKKIIEDAGIKYTCLRAPHSFEYYLYEIEITSEKYGTHYGHGWPTARIRWCTGLLKDRLVQAYLKDLRTRYNVIQCVGLASDEVKRLNRPHNQKTEFRHPLVSWGWTEKDCLEYCHSKGFDWNGLYDRFARVSCWCCPLANLSNLFKLWKYYPVLWDKLLFWESKIEEHPANYTRPKFHTNYTVKELTKKFERIEKSRRCQSSLLDFDRLILPQNITIPDTPKKMESVSVGYRSENGKLDRGDAEH